MADSIHRNWLFGWLDENHLDSRAKVATAVRDKTNWTHLIERARAEINDFVATPGGDHAIVAGRSLDLTNYLTCGHPDCISKQVDDLFSRVWHYFDEIVVVGPDAHWFVDGLEVPEARLRKWTIDMSQVYFHIQALGVDKLLRFAPKPPSCPVHWEELPGLQRLHLSEHDRIQLVRTLAAESKVVPLKRDAELYYNLQHRALLWGRNSHSAKELRDCPMKGPPSAKAAWLSVQEHWLAAASDLFLSEQLKLPVAIGIEYEAKVLSKLRPLVSEGDIAFRLKLPSMDGLSAKELLSIRAHEGDAFEAFRFALKRAMKERLAMNDTPDADAIAREIRMDVVEPSLNDIRRRLSVAEQVLNKKHKMNIGVTGLATVCGLLGVAPLAVGLTGAAVASAMSSEHKAIEEGRDISLSDMYFLWHVEQHQVQSRHKRQSRHKKKRKAKRR